jgi:aryl-alcohol dehydrogenase
VFNVLDPEPGSSFAVFGTGAVGFAGLLAAKVAGATTIVAVGVVPPPNSTGVQSGCHLLTPTQ